jgi:hypothetical protein
MDRTAASLLPFDYIASEGAKLDDIEEKVKLLFSVHGP